MELWFANGDTKPLDAGLIKVPKLDLNDVFDGYMHILFSGNAGPFLDTWKFSHGISQRTTKRLLHRLSEGWSL